MNKPLLNRFLILLTFVVSTTAVFGIIQFTRNRQASSTAVSRRETPSGAEQASKTGSPKDKTAATPDTAQGTDVKKVTLSDKRATVPKAASEEKGEKAGKPEGGREMEPINDDDEAAAGARESWFYSQRSYPLDTIPRMALSRAVERQERMRPVRRFGINGLAEPQSLPPWQSIGPRPITQGQTFGNPRVAVSGRVTAIALDPGYNGTTNKTLYVGGAQGGVWKTTDNGANWTPIMDDQPTMAIGAIAIDPTNPSVIYVGTGEANFSGDSYYGAGILKTTNGGVTWTQIKGPVSPNDPTIFAFVNVVIPKIVVDPTSPSTVYAVTNANGHTNGSTGGAGTFNIDQRGVWKSTDGGNNWTNLNPLQTNPPGQNSGTDFLIDPAKPSRLFAAIQGQGIFLFDGTVQSPAWTKLTASPLPSTGFTRVILANGPPISPSTETTIFSIYAATDSGSILGVFRSTDGGTSWTQLINPPVSGQTNYNLALAIDPTDSNFIYYGTQSGATLWRSTNGGQAWTDISQGDGVTGGVHADTHVLVVCPTNRNILFTGDDGGIWRSDNATSTPVSWTTLNSTLSITQFQGVALHPTDPNIIIGGTQDNGTDLYGGQLSWTLSQGGDGGIALIDQTNPQIMYHTFFNQTNTQIGPQLSTTGGTSWVNRGCFTNDCNRGINIADRVGFYAPMALNTGFTGANTNVVYLGTQHLYRSADRGTSWTGLGTGSDSFGFDLAPPSGRLSAIAAFPFSNSSPSTEIVWVGTSTGLVQLTTNAGALGSATFTDVTKAPLPNRFVTDIALDLTNSQRAVVTYSGFNLNTPGTPGHVFITNNQGSTWTNISGNLPDVPVTSIAIDPNNANTYYIGTDIGVFRTKDGGTTWESVQDGMPKVAVFMLRYHAATRSLVAATHGRGMFRLDVSSEAGNPIPVVANIQPPSAAVQSGAFTLTVNGSSFVAGASVLWNGQSRPTTFNGSTQLLAQIPGSDLGAAGTVTITVLNPAPGGGTSTTSATFTVTKGSQTINFGPLGNKTLQDPPFDVFATATSGLPVAFSVLSGPATISGSTVTITGAGTVTIRASQSGNQNFNAAPNVDQSFTVAKANQTITFNQPANHTFGDAPFSLSASATSLLTVSFSVVSGPATVSGSTVTLTGAGTVTIQADQTGNANFNAASFVQRSFTVAKGQAFINLSNFIQIFDGTPKSVTATTTPLGLSGLSITYNGNATAPSAVGKYSVVASLNNPNFQASNFLGTLSIVGLSPTNNQNVNPGGQNTAIVNPGGSQPGISANLSHTNVGVTANVSVGIYSDNPTERGLVNAGGGFVNVKVTNPNAGDTVVINYYYPATVTPVNEAALQLYYFNGNVWLPVKGSGNSVPVKDTTDNLDGTASGGRFTVTLDNTSSPKVSELTGTVFAATTAIMGDINGDNVVNVTDLLLMANILAGNFTPTQIQKDAADVLKDASNSINVTDLLTLANFLAGNTRTLPAGN